VAVTMPGPERLPPGPLRELVAALHDLYRDAGMPGFRVISANIKDRSDLPDTVSHETVGGILRGSGLPRWVKVECVVRVLAEQALSRPDPDTEVRRFLTLWLAACDQPTQVPPPPPDTDRGSAETVDDVADDAHADEVGPPPAEDFVVPDAEPEPQSAVNPTRLITNLPGRNADFTGRDLLLDAVHRQLTGQMTFPVILFGIGGTGKTQLTVEYAYRQEAEYDVIWWVPAEDPVAARAAMAQLAERLGIPANLDIQQTVRSVIGDLERGRHRWLLIFDNAELSDEVHALLPAVGGHTLISSRDPGWSSIGRSLEVEAFDRAESIQFLRRRGQRSDGAAADRLADLLGDLPLALEQVAATQKATGMPLAQYVELFAEHIQELLAVGKPRHYPATVVAFISIAVERLRAASPAAAHLLELFAHLGTAPLSVILLQSGRDAPVSAPLRRVLADPIQLRRTIRDLRRYGLATIDAEGQRIEVHHLVQLALREALDEAALDRGRSNLHHLLAAANPGKPTDARTWTLHAAIAPHVLPADLIGATGLDARRVVLDQIRYLNRTGDYHGGRRLGELAVTAWRPEPAEGGLGPGHELTLLATREWAEALRLVGQYEPARTLTVDTWKRLQDAYGPDHPFALDVGRGVGAYHRLNGEYAQARQVDTEILALYREVYGADDPQTLNVENNLAVNLRLQGDFVAALQVDQRIVGVRTAAFGKHDDRTLTSTSNLARDLYGLGRYADAAAMLDSCLPALREQGGSRNVMTLLAARTHAAVLRKQGKLAEAEQLSYETYENYLTSFPADHEHTLAAAMTYANAACANAVHRGRRPLEAREVVTLAVDRYRRRFGPHNPITLAAEVNQTIILRALGEGQVWQMDTMTRDELRQVLGEEHPYTLCAANGLAIDLASVGEHDAARSLFERTYEISVRVRGEDHPDTLEVAANLVLCMRSIGGESAGQELLDQTLGALRRILGPHHPVTLDVARGQVVETDLEPPPT
jgi:tetratricopeptide (TPR) repeat protein